MNIKARAFNIMTRTRDACEAWERHQAKGNAYFSSLSNLVAQQVATTASGSVVRSYTSASRLDYKQSAAISEIVALLEQLKDDLVEVMNVFMDLERDAKQLVDKALRDAKPREERVIPPLSNESLIAVAAVTPERAHKYTLAFCHNYHQEIDYKMVLLDTLPQGLNSVEDINALAFRWERQPHLEPEIKDDLYELIRLYKNIKQSVEANDDFVA
ncbi:hypothetical protein BCR43DRAFT_490749 [Syncephalastrum racemosum]|uniref:Uncharacterized protein n=1 Tax=Syncephalastrum racemosum TaxID=13706 RepID=A0A1X2HHV1_SYNRA|nr:hypothetical protein BCR43DRAFT_490749 [Syncephalastrum racemosum]